MVSISHEGPGRPGVRFRRRPLTKQGKATLAPTPKALARLQSQYCLYQAYRLWQHVGWKTAPTDSSSKTFAEHAQTKSTSYGSKMSSYLPEPATSSILQVPWGRSAREPGSCRAVGVSCQWDLLRFSWKTFSRSRCRGGGRQTQS